MHYSNLRPEIQGWNAPPFSGFFGTASLVKKPNKYQQDEMMQSAKCMFVVAVFGFVSGCTIDHPVAIDYPHFLSQHGGSVELPRTSLEAGYLVERSTQNHRYEFRAATVGYAHVWIVEFGKILDETLDAPYVQSSFGRLEKRSEETGDSGYMIEFTLDKYEFKDYRAYVAMRIALSDGDKEVFSRTYTSEGKSKGGQMWGGGPFGMKNATLDSTKSAIDKILSDFISDIPKT